MDDADRRELTPAEAAQLYLNDKQSDGLTERSLQTYESELRAFTAWCKAEEIGAVSQLDGLDMKRFKNAQAADYAPSTVGNRVRTATELLEWCVSVNAADANVVQQIEIERPNDVRTTAVSADAADAILSRLERYHYASRDHVTFLLLWEVGIRLGTLRALDLGDVGDEFEDVSGPALRIRHRPETGTTLKNGHDAERFVAIEDSTHRILTDYVTVNRPDTVDKHGREPLLTTTQGRCALSTLRATLYAVTRPCWYGDECPAGREPETCDAAQTMRDARECPENNSPHDVRRGRLTEYRRQGVDKAVISDRCDVSHGVLEEHYNEMSDGEKMEQRRDELDEL